MLRARRGRREVGVVTNEVFRTRSPHDPPGYVSPAQLLSWLNSAQERTFLAEQAGRPADPADLVTVLAVSARLATEVTAGRWVTIARLLRAGAVSSWADIGNALGVTETAAKDGFASWLVGQRALFERCGVGLTEAEAAHLSELAEGVTL